MTRKRMTMAALRRKPPIGGPRMGRPTKAKMMPAKKGRIVPMPMAPVGKNRRKPIGMAPASKGEGKRRYLSGRS